MTAMLCFPRAARAADPEAFARVVVDAADFRTGPGVSYRVVYTAHRGETIALDGRPGGGFWLRVLLPDGRVAYALGDQLQPFAVRPGESEAPSRPGLFAPPPLTGARGGLSIVGGAFHTPLTGGTNATYGYLELRPSLVFDRTLSIDAFIGDALTADGSELLYGGGASVYLAPDWPVCPFLGIGGGGLSIYPNSDSFVLQRQDLYMARAGGGLLIALRWRILVRLEATNLTLFTANSFVNAQTYAGGLGAYF
ncbi:MAG: SH3 domain-containing protein [Polyangiaceae bacterium]